MNKDSRLISFNHHIIEDVVRRSGGKYTYDQVKDVFKSSVSFILNLATYTDNASISIPHIGRMCCNLGDMKKRLHNIQRLKDKSFILYDNQEAEYDSLIKKIDDLENDKKNGLLKRGSISSRANAVYMYDIRHGKSYDEIQTLQQQQYNIR